MRAVRLAKAKFLANMQLEQDDAEVKLKAEEKQAKEDKEQE